MKKYLNLISLMFLGLITLPVSAQLRINTDLETIEQVIKNTAWIESAEWEHNNLLDSINAKQDEIVLLTAALMEYRNLHKKTLENTKGFESESMYYKEIVNSSIDIADLFTKALSAIKDTKLLNKANAVLAATDLLSQAVNCGNDFVNIVSNGNVIHPLQSKNIDGIALRSDGANLLDRYERLTMANQIATDLRKIKAQLNRIIFLCSYGDWGYLIQEIDAKTYYSMFQGKAIADQIIRRWNTRKF